MKKNNSRIKYIITLNGKQKEIPMPTLDDALHFAQTISSAAENYNKEIQFEEIWLNSDNKISLKMNRGTFINGRKT